MERRGTGGRDSVQPLPSGPDREGLPASVGRATTADPLVRRLAAGGPSPSTGCAAAERSHLVWGGTACAGDGTVPPVGSRPEAGIGCNEAYMRDPMPPKSNPVRELPPGRRIGLCWGTNPGDPSLYKQKSIPLELLLDGIRWHANDHRISLQRGEHQDRRQWRSAFAAELPDTADWCETGRWILSCDLVISADTAVAHLCGALGIPVLVVLPFHPDWRWRYGSNPCRWYRSCTTLEQQRLGDWASLLPELNQALKHYPIR